MDNTYDAVMERIRFRYVVDKPPIVTEDTIREFESEIGYPLPADYRHFLLKYGFSTGRGTRVYFPLGGPVEGNGAYVGVFYGLGLNSSYHLSHVRYIFRNRPDIMGPARRLPEHVLAIASSPGGEICMALAGPNRGRVSWWPSDGLADDPDYNAADPEDNMTHLAPDFDTFINSLRRIERKSAGT